MANSDLPNGFQPYRHKGGGTIRATEHLIASGTAANIARGDAVILSSGKVTIAADDSAAILGVVEGFSYVDTNGNQVFTQYWASGTATLGSADGKVFVYTDPDITYKVQTDTGTAFALTNIGSSFDIEKDHAANATTGQSGMELDISDTVTGQFTVIGLIDEPDNAVGVNAKVEVFNNVPVYG